MGLKEDFKKTSHTLVEAAEKKGKEIRAAAPYYGEVPDEATLQELEGEQTHPPRQAAESHESCTGSANEAPLPVRQADPDVAAPPPVRER